MPVSMDSLQQLRSHSRIAADSADYLSLSGALCQDVTTNPAIIAQWSQDLRYQAEIKRYLNNQHAYEQCAVFFGIQLLKRINGYVYTQVNPLAQTQIQMLASAEHILSLYEFYKVDINKVILKLPANLSGIKTVEYLQKYRIKSCMTMVYSLEQVDACIRAGANIVAVFSGPIKVWQKQHHLPDTSLSLLQDAKNLLSQEACNTRLLACPTDLEQALMLGGVDAICLSTPLIMALQKSKIKIKKLQERHEGDSIAFSIEDQKSFDRAKASLPVFSALYPLHLKKFIEAVQFFNR